MSGTLCDAGETTGEYCVSVLYVLAPVVLKSQ